MHLETYRDLIVWNKSMDLVELVYSLARRFPDDERFGLIGQVRRSAISIPANIAEGYGRKNRGDYLHHLSIARGSMTELETHLLIALRLHYITNQDMEPVWQVCQEVGRMLNRLIRSLQGPVSSDP